MAPIALGEGWQRQSRRGGHGGPWTSSGATAQTAGVLVRSGAAVYEPGRWSIRRDSGNRVSFEAVMGSEFICPDSLMSKGTMCYQARMRKSPWSYGSCKTSSGGSVRCSLLYRFDPWFSRCKGNGRPCRGIACEICKILEKKGVAWQEALPPR